MKIFKILVIMLFVSIMTVPCYSLTITDIGSIDSLIETRSLPNSSDTLEMDFLNDYYEPDGSIITFVKYEDPNPNFYWNSVDDFDSIYALEFQDPNPEYFILKVGNIDGGDRHLLFENIESYNYAVIDLLDDIWGGYDVDKISHVSFYASATSRTTPVPEPASMMLFGIGLLGMSSVFRRKK